MPNTLIKRPPQAGELLLSCIPQRELIKGEIDREPRPFAMPDRALAIRRGRNDVLCGPVIPSYQDVVVRFREFDGCGGLQPPWMTKTGRRYKVTLSESTLNPLNRSNFAPPNGDLSSPYFGQYRSLSKNDYAAAEPILRQALEVRERVFGPKHPATLACINNLAELLRRRGDYAAADQFLPSRD